MVDKATGLAVPILGITMHPVTGEMIPLGGAVESEITGLKTAIDKFLVFPDTPNEYRMVRTIKFDESGAIVPEYFEEIMINSAGEMLHHKDSFPNSLNSKNGSYRSFIRSTLSACDVRLLDVIEEFSEHLNETIQLVASGELIARAPIENFIKQISMANHHSMLARREHQKQMISDITRVENLKNKMEYIGTTGGVAGAFDFTGANLELPILIGSFVPNQSDHMMPILDIEISPNSS